MRTLFRAAVALFNIIFLITQGLRNIPKGSFPIEKATKLGNLAFRGGGLQKIKKVPSFSWKRVKIRGGLRK